VNEHRLKRRKIEIVKTISNYFAEVEQMLHDISLTQLQHICSILERTYREDHRIFIMGNGGSAATASHLALDLAKNTITAGAPRLKAFSLTDHTPLITAWSNDTAYEHIFVEQLANLIEPGDAVIGISASGNSANVLNALHFARQAGAATIALLGAHGGKAKSIVDAYILAPGKNIEQEEDAHMILAHVITRHMRAFVQSSARELVASLPATPQKNMYSF
jgi:D-sedoheptulose 7-phosphate isomerase